MTHRALTAWAQPLPLLALIAMVGVWSTRSCPAQETASGTITEEPTGNIFVHKVTDLGNLLSNTGSIDWSGPNNRLLIDKRGLNQYYNVFSVTPEGFRLKPLTLSLDPSGTARQHSGNASWSPDGAHFVFTSQNRGSTDYRRSIPGMGWHSNLWLGDAEGTKFWQLTTIPTSYNSPQGVAMPAFSPDGKRLLWTGATGRHSLESPWGQRAMYMADFAFQSGRPGLANIQEFQPGKQRDFYETYGFSPDGQRIYFAGNLEEDHPWYGMNIYALERGADEPLALTSTPRAWDRFAVVSPDGRKIAWSSSARFAIRYLGNSGARWARYLRSEVWIMDADGQNQKQLTDFNTPGKPESLGRRSFVGEMAWSPDGTRLAVVHHHETQNFDVESRVVILDLGKGPLEEARPTRDANGGSDEAGRRQPAPTGGTAPAMPRW